jgi:hypothetical protein
LLRWPYVGPDGQRRVQREALELKVWRKGEKNPLATGKAQLDAYLARLGLDEGILVIFDRRPRKRGVVKPRRSRTRTPSGRAVTLLRV